MSGGLSAEPCVAYHHVAGFRPVLRCSVVVRTSHVVVLQGLCCSCCRCSAACCDCLRSAAALIVAALVRSSCSIAVVSASATQLLLVSYCYAATAARGCSGSLTASR